MSLKVDIKKKLGSFTLEASFEADGEILALLGASGCGKSMTLKCIAGIEKPDEGFISLDGRVLFDSKKHINLTPQKRRVGYLFQQYALFPDMTVYQNVAAGVRKERRRERDEIVRAQLRAMRLTGLEDARPDRLSGGQQQRVALARILVNQPELLLLDEPFSALDSYLKWQLELELMDALKSFSGPVLFVSHSRDEVFRICENVCVLSGGRTEPVRTVKELFDSPRTMSACLLTGCKNFSAVTPSGGGRVLAADWGVELSSAEAPERDDEFIGIRASALRPAKEGGGNTSECDIITTVEDEDKTILILLTPGGGRLRMELEKAEGQKYRQGEKISVLFPPDEIMLLKR